ncbi:MAG: D-tyrosyl-tRNA(Tyr) deacylase [Oscillospiraceae bacterium]|jgi:D-tyrosyl-tRNA(Tyr) deacylase|nr:D-tyrosyl-tRNA(Tyr) deacylase [Oscillospiraceae bacterium]
MKTIIQRVLNCKLEAKNIADTFEKCLISHTSSRSYKPVSQIEKGIVVFLGIQKGDTEKDAEVLCEKILNLRIFEDESRKMNLSLKNISGEIMIVSNFTICSNTKHGRRPSFECAAPPETAKKLYENFCENMNKIYVPEKVKTGRFGSEMKITIINDGPVNIIIESIEGKIN